MSATTSPTRSALGLRGPTILSQRRGMRNSLSSAFRLPIRAANIMKALRKIDAVGI